MKRVMVLAILLNFSVLFFEYEAYSEPAPGTVRYVYGYGGVIEQPDGTFCYCPFPSSDLCAVIRTGVTGIPDYPDELTHYENGQPLETVNVREAGKNEHGQPTWFVQPSVGKCQRPNFKVQLNDKKSQ